MFVLANGEVVALSRAAQQDAHQGEPPVGEFEAASTGASSRNIDRFRGGSESVQNGVEGAVSKLTMRIDREAGYAAIQPQPGLVAILDDRWRACRRGLLFHTMSAPEQPARVSRGGSWNNDNPRNVRSSNRNRNEPTNRNNNIGFRCARQWSLFVVRSRPARPCATAPLLGAAQDCSCGLAFDVSHISHYCRRFALASVVSSGHAATAEVMRGYGTAPTTSSALAPSGITHVATP